MKKILFMLPLFVGMMFSTNSFAGSGGPDTFGYIWMDSKEAGGPAYKWIDIKSKPGAIQVNSLSDDNTMGPFTIPFNFHYYWYDLNKFWVGSNGYVIFNAGNMAHPFPAIPSTSQPQDYVAIMETDLTFNTASGTPNPGKCYYWFNNSHDTLIVSYLDVPFWVDANTDANEFSGSNTFQVIFSAVDSSITMQYRRQTGISEASSQAISIGIENISGTGGLQHSYDSYPDSSYAVKYYYPKNSTFSVKDASVSWEDNPETAGLFLSWKGAKHTLISEIKNTGNISLSPFNVNGKVVNKSSITQGMQSTVLSNPLNASASEKIIFQYPFNPLNQGVFRFVTTTQLTGDMVSTNNVLAHELVVVDTSVNEINLGFTDNTSEGAGLSWSGGSGGAGVYFIPPFYPCMITKLSFFTIGNPLQSIFDAKVYDDDGPGGIPGTLLDSVRPANPPVDDAGHWENLVLNKPLLIQSGGFYVGWLMEGDMIGLGQDEGVPISNRTYEILGNTWAIYRSREIEDLMIQAYISPNIPTGISENENEDISIYPLPANNKIFIKSKKADLKTASTIEIVDILGRKEKSINGYTLNGEIGIDVSGLAQGIHFLRISHDGSYSFQKKLIISR